MLLCMAACGPDHSPGNQGEARLPTLPVTLPNGNVIRAELAASPADQQRGLMFRTELPSDCGMLFVFPAPGNRPFWMYHTLIPLDILWLDAGRRIVFISAETPPCPSENGENCPSYGGEQPAQFVLELGAGTAARNGLKAGDTLQF
jgi:uncharacterized membrane protein (UPF0127 family)